MSHNINESRMFYTGEKPWHGIGTHLQNPATAQEAIKAAKLDYKVSLQEVVAKFENSEISISNKKAVVREDTKDVLGVVGDGYRIIPNVNAFSFFDTIVGEGQAIYHTAGALGRGERIWILAKLPKDLVITREDIVEKYLILMNSHNGSSPLRIYFSPVRVVCQNTLNMSLSDASQGVSIRHSGSIQSKVDQAREILGITVNYYKQFELIAKQLVDVKINSEFVNSYFDTLIGKTEDDEDTSTRKLLKKGRLLYLFEHGRGNEQKDVKHSLWAAYNAVTEYADYYKTTKNVEKDPTKKLDDIWFGSGAYLKGKAFELAVASLKK